MTVSLGGVADAIKSRLKGAANRVKDAVRRDRGHDVSQTEDRLTEEARKKPQKSKKTGLSSSTSVSETDADDSLEPAEKKSEAQWPKPAELARYGKFLTNDIIGGTSSHAGLQGLLHDLSRPGSDLEAMKPHLADHAGTHVRVTIEELPQDFGLPKNAIQQWLRQSHKTDSMAADLKQFLTQELARQGHGAAVADWLYQQILAAGSTCMAALELEGGNTERCQEYLQRAITEIRANAAQFNTPALATTLLARWQDADTARLKQDNERIQALSRWVQTASKDDPDTGKSVQVSRKLKPHPTLRDRTYSIRQETVSASETSQDDFSDQ